MYVNIVRVFPLLARFIDNVMSQHHGHAKYEGSLRRHGRVGVAATIYVRTRVVIEI